MEAFQSIPRCVTIKIGAATPESSLPLFSPSNTNTFHYNQDALPPVPPLNPITPLIPTIPHHLSSVGSIRIISQKPSPNLHDVHCIRRPRRPRRSLNTTPHRPPHLNDPRPLLPPPNSHTFERRHDLAPLAPDTSVPSPEKETIILPHIDRSMAGGSPKRRSSLLQHPVARNRLLLSEHSGGRRCYTGD